MIYKNKKIINNKNILKKEIEKMKKMLDIKNHLIKKIKNKKKENINISKTFKYKKIKEIYIPKTISILEISNKMSLKVSKVIKTLMNMGIIVTINELIDQKTAKILIKKMGYKFRKYNFKNSKKIINKNTKYLIRTPIVTIMGHVNHGKTSLLDYIRKTNVALLETGGITQNIGAYYVKTNFGIITFIDTPGHKAFTSIRKRGIKITDIIILIVAVDDGVMPQTKEVISYAKIKNIPIIVGINKIDKIGINIEKIYKQLVNLEIIPEKYGGNYQFVNISTKTGEGINSLLECISVQAEIMELKYNINAPARGVVIESRLDENKGPIISIIMKSGILKKGDIVLIGYIYGKIKLILNENFIKLNEVKPSIPVEIYGLMDLPNIGDKILVVENEKKAREMSFLFKKNIKNKKLLKESFKNINNTLNKKIENQELKQISLIIKTNLLGSQESIIQSLKKLSNKKVNINIIYTSIGNISENDINLAITFKAIIIGFNIKTNSLIKKIAKNNNINIYYYNIIYDVINKIKKIISNIDIKKKNEKKIGLVEIKQVFGSKKTKSIAGGYVKEGIIKKKSLIKLIRNNTVIWKGKLESLKRFKENIKEVKFGFECGISLKNFNDIKINDKLEIIEI